MFRYYCIILFIAIFCIVSFLIFPIELLIGMFGNSVRDISCFRTVQWAFKVVLKISGVTVTVKGEENVPDVPVLFVSNHRSLLDIPLTYVRHKNITGYIAKDELEHIPGFSTWMRLTYCLFLNRTDARAGLMTILKAIEQVRAGISMFVFPEGTRNRGDEGTMLPFKNGSFKIAVKSGCPIVPVAVNNSFALFEKQFPRVVKTHVVIEYGKPVYTDRMDNEAQRRVGDHVRGIISEMLARNSGLV